MSFSRTINNTPSTSSSRVTSMNTTPRPRGRGGGAWGRGGSSSFTTTTTSPNVNINVNSSRVTSASMGSRRGSWSGGGRPRGRGRGGGGGRGRGAAAKLNASLHQRNIYMDGDDDICQQALGQYELDTSEMAKALEESKDASQLPGFDETAGQIWIYPTNKPVRDYQFQMVQTALFHNTLVSLPTGLGKTFIAAVVMYNFHRWYPSDVIIFMAPTRPLVRQQLEACHNLVGISPSKTVELTGHIPPKKREDLWKTKSVFFLTPQVMQSDLSKGVCPVEKVRCIVVDEAHKALGHHAYAEVISMLIKTNARFRVLALSATPGSDLTAVQQVFKNLLVSRVQLRCETDPDILPYVHGRQKEVKVVALDPYLKSVQAKVVEAFQIYTGKLLKNNAIRGNDGTSYSPYLLLSSRNAWRLRTANKLPNSRKGYIEADFNTAICLSHALEGLVTHGLRSFFTYLQAVFNKEKSTPAVAFELKKSTQLQDVLNEIQQKLRITSPNSSLNQSKVFMTFSKDNESASTSTTLDDENDNDQPQEEDYLASHPKMKVLKDIVLDHFKKFETSNDTTRIMIFSQYRESAQEIGAMLNTLGRLVKPMVFIGQANTGTGRAGKGLKQKDQVQVIQRFRDGGFNVLVATSVGEEGLDIGEVDLIICFDTSKSPTRLVQRMGRTGRQREGRIIFLLTEGKEEMNYRSSLSSQSSIGKNITDTKKLEPFLYKHSPRMVPLGVEPECFKMNVVLTSEQDVKNENINNMTDDDDYADDDEDDDEEEEPAEIDDDYPSSPDVDPTIKIPSKSVPSKKKLKNTIKKKSRPGSSIGRSDTLTQCFTNLFKKPIVGDQTTTVSPKPSSSTITRNHEAPICTNILDNDVVMLDEGGFNEIGNQSKEDDDDEDFLNDIFGVVDPSTVKSNPCLNIPKPTRPFRWLPEYNDLDPSLLLISGYELECLTAKIDALKPYKDHCHCGNNNMDNYDFDFERGEGDNNFFPIMGGIVSKASPANPQTRTATPYSGNGGGGSELDVLNGGFLMDENDPFFDDGSDDDAWLQCLDEDYLRPANKSSSSVEIINSPTVVKNDNNNVLVVPDTPPSPPLSPIAVHKQESAANDAHHKIVPDPPNEPSFHNNSAPLLKKTKFTFKLKTSLNDATTTAQQPLPSIYSTHPHLDVKISPTKPSPPAMISPDLKQESAANNMYSEGSTTSFEEELASPILQHKIHEDSNEENKSCLSKTTNCKDNNNSTTSTTSNDEQFHSPAWRQKLSLENKSTTNIVVEKPQCFSPPSPPSIFNRSTKRIGNFSTSTAVARSLILSPKAPIIIANPQNHLPQLPSTSTSFAPFNTATSRNDTEIMQLDDSKTMNQSSLSSNKKQFTFKFKSQPPTPPQLSLVDSSFESSPPPRKKVALLTPIKSSSSSSLVPKNALSKNNNNDNDDWIDTNSSRPPRKTVFVSSKLKVTTTKVKSQTFKKPPPPPSTNKRPAIVELSDDDDEDDFIIPVVGRKNNVIPSPSAASSFFTERGQSSLNTTSSPLSSKMSGFAKTGSGGGRGGGTIQRDLNSSFHGISPISKQSFKRKNKKRRKIEGINPFLALEADVSDDEGSSSCDAEDEFDGLDEYDTSFVDTENDIGVTDSQQVRYIKSVRSPIHQPGRRIEQPLQPRVDNSSILTVEDPDYESDSFCVSNDEVEFADVGVFTQAMDIARQEVMRDDESASGKQRRTRRQAKKDLQPATTSKGRRRIILNDSSDE